MWWTILRIHFHVAAGHLSPGFVSVVKPVNPPTPPIRKPLPATPVVETPTEKPRPPFEPPQIPTTPTHHLEAYGKNQFPNIRNYLLHFYRNFRETIFVFPKKHSVKDS